MLHDPILNRGPVALLVDGENFHAPNAAKLADVTAEFGPATLRRVYGNAEQIKSWDGHGYRLCPSRPGKNSADLLLCVQAMRLMLHDGFKTIIIASSDRDYTYLAEELRELGAMVVGVGGPSALTSFRNSCTRFIVIGAAPPNPLPRTNLTNSPVPAAKAASPKTSQAHVMPSKAAESNLFKQVKSLMQSVDPADGIPIQLLGSKLGKIPGLSAKQYGAATWTKVFKDRPSQYVVKKDRTENIVRLKV